MDQYFTLRRSVEQPADCLESIVSRHAVAQIDWLIYKRAISEDMLFKLENEWKSYVCGSPECGPLRDALKRMIDSKGLVNAKVYSRMSSKASRGCYETQLQMTNYRQMWDQLVKTRPDSDNFYTCATVYILMAQKLGFWLDVILYE